jgi:hypothetical protein
MLTASGAVVGGVMVLTFVIIFVVGMAWDTGRVNRLLGTTINPGQKPTSLR